jgi:hypothetical protein
MCNTHTHLMAARKAIQDLVEIVSDLLAESPDISDETLEAARQILQRSKNLLVDTNG